eukprot:7054409-Prymnesium_polylepis.1
MLRLTDEPTRPGACPTLRRSALRHAAIWPWMYRLSVDRQQLDHINPSALTPRLLAEQLRL